MTARQANQDRGSYTISSTAYAHGSVVPLWQVPATQELAAVAVLCIGVGLATVSGGELDANVVGVGIAVAAIFVTSIYQVGCGACRRWGVLAPPACVGPCEQGQPWGRGSGALLEHAACHSQQLPSYTDAAMELLGLASQSLCTPVSGTGSLAVGIGSFRHPTRHMPLAAAAKHCQPDVRPTAAQLNHVRSLTVCSRCRYGLGPSRSSCSWAACSSCTSMCRKPRSCWPSSCLSWSLWGCRTPRQVPAVPSLPAPIAPRRAQLTPRQDWKHAVSAGQHSASQPCSVAGQAHTHTHTRVGGLQPLSNPRCMACLKGSQEGECRHW